MGILDQSRYDEVRKVLDISFDETMIPDSTIELDVYAGAAERELLRLVPDYATLTDTNKAIAKTALIYLVAARLAPAVPAIVSESTEDHSYSRQSTNWTQRGAELRAQAHQEIDAVAAQSETEARPTTFTTAGGGRGGLYTP